MFQVYQKKLQLTGNNTSRKVQQKWVFVMEDWEHVNKCENWETSCHIARVLYQETGFYAGFASHKFCGRHMHSY